MLTTLTVGVTVDPDLQAEVDRESVLEDLPTLTYPQALSYLAAVVAEKGEEHVYSRSKIGSSCTYARDGEPSCIVGQVLHKAGWSVEALQELDRLNTTCSDGFANGQAVVFKSGRLDDRASRLLSTAQARQDSGATWGQAMGAAIDRVASAV